MGCTCGGGTASMRLLSYPGPVIAVPTFDPGARPGSTGCGVAGTSGSTLATAPSLRLGHPGISEVTTYPGPVIPVRPRPVPWTPPAPPPPPVTVSWDANGTVSIRDGDGLGAAVTCSWTVEFVYGDLTLKTKTEPRGDEGRFGYVVTPASSEHGASPRRMVGSRSGDKEKLWKGAWSVEMKKPDERWELKSSDCSETDGTTSSSAAGTTAQIGLDPGDEVTCTFEMKLLAPKPGKWRAENGRGLASCGGRLPPVTEAGSLKVRRDGDVLIGRGLSPGSSTVRLNRDQGDPRRYSGKLTINQSGARGTFDTTLRLIDEKHMEGAFSGKVKVRGQSCTFSRPLKLTYAGR